MFTKILLPLLAVQLVACSASSPSSNVPNDETAEFVPSVLPVAGNFDCAEVAAPSVCDWANSVDAIVVGTIVEATALTSPVWVFGEEQQLADQCAEDGWFVNPGVSLKLEVDDWLYGEGATEIVAHVGHAGLVGWGTLPYEENGALQWVGDPDTLAEGSTVGLALTKVPGTQTWSLMGELPFTFAADGASVFRDDECNPAPTPLPSDFESLASALATCETTTNDAYDARISEYTQRPDFSYAGACHPSPTPTQ